MKPIYQRPHCGRLAILFIVLIFQFSDVNAQWKLKVIAHSGQSAPGTNGAIFIKNYAFDPAVIDNRGSVYFYASLEAGTGDGNGFDDVGLWAYHHDTLKLIARVGHVIPSSGGVVIRNDYYAIPDLRVDQYNDNDLLLIGEFSHNGIDFFNGFMTGNLDGSFLLHDPLGFEPYPNTSLINYTLRGFRDSQVFLEGYLKDNDGLNFNNHFLGVYGPYIFNNYNLVPIARGGEPMAGFPDQVYRFGFGSGSPLKFAGGFEISGNAVIYAVGNDKDYLNDTVANDNIYALYEYKAFADLNLIRSRIEGEQKIVLARTRVNINGDMAFLGYLDNYRHVQDMSIWAGKDFNRIIASYGDIPPGVTSSDSLIGFREFDFFDNGSVAFYGQLSGNHKGIWMEATDKHLVNIALTGKPLPGSAIVNNFDVFHYASNFNGTIAFRVWGTDAQNNDIQEIWAGDADGLEPVMRTGNQVTISDGDTRTIRSFFIPSRPATNLLDDKLLHSGALNIYDELLVQVEFTDGSYAVVVASEGFIVNSTDDDEDIDPGDGVCECAGPLINGKSKCTLRAAIMEANASEGRDKIKFDIPQTDSGYEAGHYIIMPGKQLPAVNYPVVIDGFTQKGFKNGFPVIVLDGTDLGKTADYALSLGGGNSTVQGLIIQNFKEDAVGIKIHTKGNNTVRACYIGTNPDNEMNVGMGSNGILIDNTAGNIIGGEKAMHANVISGNDAEGGTSGCGILIKGPAAKNNTVMGNLIGTDRTGMSAIANPTGVCIENAPENLIGSDSTELSGNVISGNQYGISITGISATGNRISGNFIGVTADGLTSLPNSRGGIIIIDAPGNVIGGKTKTAGDPPGNVISGNYKSRKAPGISITGPDASGNEITGNLIGLNWDGTNSLPNTTGIQIIQAENTLIGGIDKNAGNVISGNNEDGIYLENASGTVIQNNYVGTDIQGTNAMPNGQNGVHILSAENNLIGGNLGESGNLLSGNFIAGILIETKNAGDKSGNTITGNLIGTDINGNQSITNSYGIMISDGFFNTIGGAGNKRNIISGNLFSGIGISGESASNNEIYGNFIGLDKAGMAKVPNDKGVVLSNGATGNTIGGEGDKRNLISGNFREGILIYGDNGKETDTKANVVAGNYIGVGADGTTAFGNGEEGILIMDASGNFIGGKTDSERNIIVNNLYGISIVDSFPNTKPQAWENRVEGNYIGIDALGQDGTQKMQYGIIIENASANIIGGRTTHGFGQPPGNVIANNEVAGIIMYYDIDDKAFDGENTVEGNVIGAASGNGHGNGNGVIISNTNNNNILNNLIWKNDTTGVLIYTEMNGITLSNTVSRNSIYGNGGLGIDLGEDVVTLNDEGDTDTGPNNLQNFPDLLEVDSAGIITGTLRSTANTPFTIEFFLNDFADPSHYGEGQMFITSQMVTTNGNGRANFFVTVPPLPKGACVSATATNDKTFDTSEFSECLTVTSYSAFAVNSTGDDPDNNPGDGLCRTGNVNTDGKAECTLRAAIEEINASAGNHPWRIPFNIPGPGPHTIKIKSALPEIKKSVFIHGSGQPGFVGKPLIELDGSEAGNADGLVIAAGGSRVEGLVINRFNGAGILLQGYGNSGIFHNYIGTDASGVTAMGNSGNGIQIENSDNNFIGFSADSVFYNLIAFNGEHGVNVLSGKGNVIMGNSIHSNEGQGINLAGGVENPQNVTQNDEDDSDDGANGLQNFPVLYSIKHTDDSVTITAGLNSKPDKDFLIAFYSGAECDGPGYGEGEYFMGYVTVKTGLDGMADFEVTLPAPPDTHRIISATATDLSEDGTSEFSACINAIITGIPGDAGLKDDYYLWQSYPNPFHTSVSISFYLKKDADVSLKIFDLQGKELEELAGRHMARGYHSITWTPANKASGTYLYRLTANEFTMTRSMQIIR